jgi:hypothetical protein
MGRYWACFIVGPAHTQKSLIGNRFPKLAVRIDDVKKYQIKQQEAVKSIFMTCGIRSPDPGRT